MSTIYANFNYTQDFPSELPDKMVQSFVLTTVIDLVAGSSYNVALLGGGIAVTATVIESVTRPILKAIFPKHPTITKCVQVVMPKMMALGLAASLTPWIGVAYKTSWVLFRVVVWVALNQSYYERNVAMTEVL